MKIDITYRTVETPRRRLLRVRFRQADRKSAIVLSTDPQHFSSLLENAGLSDPATEALESDASVVALMSSSVHFGEVELKIENLARLRATDWREPQKFNLSFERTDNKIRLKGREVDPRPGLVSLNVTKLIAKEELASALEQVKLHPRDVRDLNLHGSQSSRQVDEDEVELLFNAVRR
jgi:hypothetical protein